MQGRVGVEILVEAILRLQGTIQGLASIVVTSVSGTQALLAISGLLHGVRVVQQVIIGVEVIVVAVGRLWLLRVVFVLATCGVGRAGVLPVDHLVALIGVHLITEVCRKF